MGAHGVFHMLDFKFHQRLNQAFLTVPRQHFMISDNKNLANLDLPQPIGHRQTISQPTTVKKMLTWLNPGQGDKILDIGSGSGWSSALLSYLTGEDGKVFAAERIPELKLFGENNCHDFGCKNIEFFLTDKKVGLKSLAPFDRILVSASYNYIPDTLIDQLAPGGTLVIPIKNSIMQVKKDLCGNIEYTKEHFGYMFVPLIIKEDSGFSLS
jgi:protein-L-isoaspartate(D-aspartate) O-methyltransferase